MALRRDARPLPIRRLCHPHAVTLHSASTVIARLILLRPCTRSTKVIGTSTTRKPAYQAFRAMSTWKQ